MVSPLVTAEIFAKIFEYLLAWGAPGIIIILLLEERRRLNNKIDTLSKKLEASYEARIEVNKEAFEAMSDQERAFDRLNQTMQNLLTYRFGGKQGD